MIFPKSLKILQQFKLFIIELLTARAGLYVKQEKNSRG